MPSSPPSAEGRKKCWDSRDDYFTCLTSNKEDQSKCMETRKVFESSCSRTWVKYFEKRRDFEKYKAKLLKDGAQELPDDKKYGKS